jgi:outer membrane protein OmpA-like peptidoglycan-associated protein
MSRLATLATTTASDNDFLTRTPRLEDASLDSGSGIGGWLSGLWSGGGVSGITNAISRYAGVRASSASSLLSLGGPLVIGYLGRLMRSDNLDATRLAQRLQAERGTLAAALPAGFNAFLPSASHPTETRQVYNDVVVRDVPEAVRREKPRSGSLLWPLALLALAIAGLFWWNNRTRTTTTQVVNTASRAADAVGSTVRTLPKELPGGVKLTVPGGGMEDRLISYLSAPAQSGTRSFDFDRLEFETGSTALTSQSRAQIADVARILNAYPNARVQIAGYTDNTGNEADNLALSRGRAEAVMSALRDHGAPAANITAEGFGSQNPIADNSTESGRARNRRVTLSIAP